MQPPKSVLPGHISEKVIHRNGSWPKLCTWNLSQWPSSAITSQQRIPRNWQNYPREICLM